MVLKERTQITLVFGIVKKNETNKNIAENYNLK